MTKDQRLGCPTHRPSVSITVMLDHSREISCFSSHKSVRAGAELTKTAVCIKTQPSFCVSKSFCNSIQCGSGTWINVLCFEKWNYQKSVLAVDEKQDISLHAVALIIVLAQFQGFMAVNRPSLRTRFVY